MYYEGMDGHYSRQVYMTNIYMMNYIKQREQFLNAIQPYINMMASLQSMQPVIYIQQGDNWLTEVKWKPDDKKVYDSLQEVIDYLKQKFIKECIDVR